MWHRLVEATCLQHAFLQFYARKTGYHFTIPFWLGLGHLLQTIYENVCFNFVKNPMLWSGVLYLRFYEIIAFLAVLPNKMVEHSPPELNLILIYVSQAKWQILEF